MSARVFMSAPMQRLSCQFAPAQRAPSVQPPSLPSMATAQTKAQAVHAMAELKEPMFVFSPVLVKKIGTSATTTKSPNFSRQALTRLASE